MGAARDAMDRVTEAYFGGDPSSATKWYAADAVAIAPDGQEYQGPEAIVTYMQEFFAAFPDAKYESLGAWEIGDTAWDEGRFSGANTGPLAMPDGSTLPATGKTVTMRGADVVTVEDGLITSHRFYFDQMSFLAQLGLMPEA